MSKTVDQYVLEHKNWQAELELLRKLLHQTDLAEEVKWGAPVYTIEGKNIVGLGAFKSYFGLWFFQGALLEDKDGVLLNAQEGKTKAMRQWRFNSIDKIVDKKVLHYVLEAIENQRQGKEIKPEKSTGAVLPEELITLLKSDRGCDIAFNKLTPYKQKEYAEYISEAKREATKMSRLEKIKPMILAGVGLHDKYR